MLNYRKNDKKLPFLQQSRDQENVVKNQGETEILDAMKLIEGQDVKFIDENQTTKEKGKKGKPTPQPTLQLMSDLGNLRQHTTVMRI